MKKNQPIDLEKLADEVYRKALADRERILKGGNGKVIYLADWKAKKGR